MFCHRNNIDLSALLRKDAALRSLSLNPFRKNISQSLLKEKQNKQV